jgi:hypothetical protein
MQKRGQQQNEYDKMMVLVVRYDVALSRARYENTLLA